MSTTNGSFIWRLFSDTSVSVGRVFGCCQGGSVTQSIRVGHIAYCSKIFNVDFVCVDFCVTPNEMIVFGAQKCYSRVHLIRLV